MKEEKLVHIKDLRNCMWKITYLYIKIIVCINTYVSAWSLKNTWIWY